MRSLAVGFALALVGVAPAIDAAPAASLGTGANLLWPPGTVLADVGALAIVPSGGAWWVRDTDALPALGAGYALVTLGMVNEAAALVLIHDEHGWVRVVGGWSESFGGLGVALVITASCHVGGAEHDVVRVEDMYRDRPPETEVSYVVLGLDRDHMWIVRTSETRTAPRCR